MNRTEFVSTLANLRSASTFLVLHKYRNAHGETADFNIVFHMSYENALKKSIAAVEAYNAVGSLAEQAKTECLASYKKSLLTVQTTPIEEVDDAYARFFDDDDKEIKGIKLHRETDTLHLFGLIHLKRVIVPGTYKKVNHRDLTIEKKKIQKLCPVDRFRQFRLVPNQVEKITVEKMDILPPGNDDEV
jgi:hypothetical protein